MHRSPTIVEVTRRNLAVEARSASWLAALSLAIPLLVACGGSDASDDDDGSAPGVTAGGAGGEDGTGHGAAGAGGNQAASFLACPGGTRFRLLGDVGGEAVEITEAPATGGFFQQSNPPGPHFRVPNDSADDDEQSIVVYLTWDEVVASGEVAPIEGWVRLPVGAALAGETICAGSGSEMTIPGSDNEAAVGDFQFHLVELSRGTDCTEPLTGELQGCWRH
jgi:hypothetical protein